ncbi:MAG: DUF1549 domain-containing protein, partial [Verrucomicrobia bacterium]|nr:DUF1549 domain-containing protein [Verrucomicrobiota bacterium]
MSGEIDFNRDIRPLLSDRCFACHGPDAQTREAELRLDIREVAVALREGIQVIRPGDSGGSELVRRIMTSDKSDLMPPEDSGKSLSEEEKVILKEWIDQGAVYQEHWSFQPVSRVDIPEVAQESDEELSSIDRFLLSRLNSMGMGYSPEADPVTLIRRLSFDLLGLPPERGWVERYANSQSFDVYVSLVDEILMSPHFGERLAVFWLDLVRYADTIGYHSDNHREVSGFRDYVIQSFNANKPFDQFTREQIAGDLLDDPDPWVRIASGYNRLLQTTEEGGAQAQEYRAIYAADRVRNVSSTWLGATLGCAQCHDHKYDPFTTKDFYSMAAFFDDIDEPAVGSQKPNFIIPDSELQSQVNQVEVEAALAGNVVLDFGDCAVSQAVALPQGMVELGQSELESTGLGFLVSGDRFNFSSSADGLASEVNRMSRHGVSLKDGVRWKRLETEHGDGELTLFFCLNFKANEGNRVGNISLHNERGAWVRKYPVNLDESGGRPIIFMLHVPSGEEEVELFCKADGGIDPVLCGVGVHQGAYEVQKLGGIRFDIESMAQVDQEWGDSNTGLRYVPEMQAKAENGTTLQRLEDGSYLSSGKNPDKEVYRVWIPLAVGGESKPVYGIHLEALRHETMKQASLSRANGNFVMTGMEVWVGDGNDRRRLGIA